MVGDTLPLVAFFADQAGDPIGNPRPELTWSSPRPTVVAVVSDSFAMAIDTGQVDLMAISRTDPPYTLTVPLEVIPRWDGTLAWIRQPSAGAPLGPVVKALPGHEMHQVSGIGHPDATSGDPSLSSDGRLLAVVAPRPVSPVADLTIFVANVLTGQVTAPLAALPGFQFAPVWFPDDTLLAFLMAAVGGYQVFTTRPDGSEIEQRTAVASGPPPFFDVTPDQTLVLELRTQPAAPSDFYELALAGDTIRQITFTPGYEEGSPSVSPDGTMIAYVATLVDQGSDVWIMDRDGANARPLLPITRVMSGSAPLFRAGDASSRTPSWTPDSRFVLLTWFVDPYLRNDGLVYDVLGEIYAIRIADGLAVRLTFSSTLDSDPLFR